MRDFRLWIAVVGVVFGGWLIAVQLGSGHRSAPVRQDELETTVFVCRESGEVFVGKVRSTPASHPVTGRPTLMPGLYSPDEGKWIAGPSLDELQRSPQLMKTARSKSPLERKGPVPETATQI